MARIYIEYNEDTNEVSRIEFAETSREVRAVPGVLLPKAEGKPIEAERLPPGIEKVLDWANDQHHKVRDSNLILALRQAGLSEEEAQASLAETKKKIKARS